MRVDICAETIDWIVALVSGEFYREEKKNNIVANEIISAVTLVTTDTLATSVTSDIAAETASK